jgi:hypothetical protein
MACEDNSVSLSEVQVLAHELEQEFAYASSAQQARVNTAAEYEAQCKQRLETAGQSMGHTMPDQGVQPPTPGFELDHFQLEVLEDKTISPTGCTSTTTSEGGASAFTPVTAGVGASAFIPVAVGGNNPTGPGLPTFFTNVDTTPPVANNFPLAQNFPVNCGTRASNPTAVC